MNEPDYEMFLKDAINALSNIEAHERSEEVGETLEAVIDDLEVIYDWLFGKGESNDK